jgi:hypothetical protein
LFPAAGGATADDACALYGLNLKNVPAAVSATHLPQLPTFFVAFFHKISAVLCFIFCVLFIDLF